MNEKKLQMMLLVIFSFFLCSCINAPPKPNLELCIVNYPGNILYCGQTSMSSYTSTKQINYSVLTNEVLSSRTLIEKPISYLDKGTGLTPGNWESLMDYLHELEDFAQNHCSN